MEAHIDLVRRLSVNDKETIAARMSVPKMIDIDHAITGICTEGAGELSDTLKRHLYYGVDFDYENALEEVGDLLWYTELLCQACGFTMEEAKQSNIEKLTKRYPSGDFIEEEAIARADKVGNDWIKNIGACPVDYDVVVEVRLRHGEENSNRAGAYRWARNRSDDDIMEWRTVV